MHNASNTPEYRTWAGMKNRCLNPNNPRYKSYGGRGISVCSEWIESFSAFLSHVGLKPSPLHSIDRINNDGNYEPGNVRWATAKEQARNTRVYGKGTGLKYEPTGKPSGRPIKTYTCNTCGKVVSTNRVRVHGQECLGKPK